MRADRVDFVKNVKKCKILQIFTVLLYDFKPNFLSL